MIRVQETDLRSLGYSSHHSVTLDDELGTLDGNGPAAPTLVGLTQLHADATDATDVAVVRKDLNRLGEQF